MARIDGVDDRNASMLARTTFGFARKRLGKVPGPLRVMAHHPWILTAAGGFELGLERARRVPMRVKVFAEIRAATLVGCPF